MSKSGLDFYFIKQCPNGRGVIQYHSSRKSTGAYGFRNICKTKTMSTATGPVHLRAQHSLFTAWIAGDDSEASTDSPATPHIAKNTAQRKRSIMPPTAAFLISLTFTILAVIQEDTNGNKLDRQV